jgi:hypothetical protein
MIDINKKYRTRDGEPVELITTEGRGDYSVLGYVGNGSNLFSWDENGYFRLEQDGDSRDLVEVNPYEDWEIDDKIEVSEDGVDWRRRHFAGVDKKGKLSAWASGKTRWSNADESNPVFWRYARKPKEGLVMSWIETEFPDHNKCKNCEMQQSEIDRLKEENEKCRKITYQFHLEQIEVAKLEQLNAELVEALETAFKWLNEWDMDIGEYEEIKQALDKARSEV